MCVGHIIAITDGNQVRTVKLAGTHNMFQKDMELFNNSETGMISVCLTKEPTLSSRTLRDLPHSRKLLSAFVNTLTYQRKAAEQDIIGTEIHRTGSHSIMTLRRINPQRAKTQNITVGVSFGARRELAFLHATAQENKLKMYFPQTNNGVFSFGRDVNIHFKHGINALAVEEQDRKGRISIILLGLAEGVIEEENSPQLLGSDGQGPHAAQRHGGRYGSGRGGRGRR